MSAAHGHSHSHNANANDRRITATLALVICYMLAELIGGLWSNSLALLADAGHMFSDAGALLIALVAMRIARRPASTTHTFGYRRAEVLAALANGATLVGIASIIAYQAVQRLAAPPRVNGTMMFAVAAGGLAVNLLGLLILRGGTAESVNVKGAWLHVLADTLGSVGAIASGALVMWLDWRWADPAASLAISALVVYSAWLLIRQTAAVLMQTVPATIDLDAVAQAMTSVEGVSSVHDLHVWSITPDRPIMSAHLSIFPQVDRQALMSEIQRRLTERFNLHHSTIQLDCPAACAPCPGLCSEQSDGLGQADRSVAPRARH